MKQPNVLFLMTDQQRWDAMSCSGDWVNTPNLDRIAGEGVRFNRCMTTTPICIPARVTLATGLYPHNTAVWSNIQYTLPESAQTWMRELQGMGYRTSLFGKTHLHPHRGDLREREYLLNAWGLDDVNETGGPRASAAVMSHMTALWEKEGVLEAYRRDFAERFATKPHLVRPSALPLELYYDVYVAQQAKRYLERYDRDQPWFCWISFGGPHEPWDAPEPYASMYDPTTMPKPVQRPELGNSRPQGWLDRFIETRSPDLEPGDAGAMRANYAGNVTLIDDQIGEVLNAIEARGELDNTIIAFTSDHGEMNGDWGLIYKMNFLDGSVRVPLLFRTPETANNGKAHVVDTPVENAAVGATLVALAQGELSYDHFSQPLAATVRNVTNGGMPADAISEINGEFMYTDGDWKMALNRDGQIYLLFHLSVDRFEEVNLAGNDDYHDIANALKARLLERLSTSQLRQPWN